LQQQRNKCDVQTLAAIAKDAPIEVKLPELEIAPSKRPALVELYRELGLQLAVKGAGRKRWRRRRRRMHSRL